MLKHTKRHLFSSFCIIAMAALAAGCNSRLEQHQQLQIKNIESNQVRVAIEHSRSISFREDSPTFGINLIGDEPPVNLHYDIPLLEANESKPAVLTKLVNTDRELSLFRISAKNQPTLNKVLAILKVNQQQGIEGNVALNVKLDNACSTLASSSDMIKSVMRNDAFELTAPERVTVWIKTVKNGYYQKLLDRVDITEQKALSSCTTNN